MKNLKRIMGLLVVPVVAFSFSVNVHAASETPCGTVSDLDSLKTEAAKTTCTEITISNDIIINEDLDITDKHIVIANGVTLTVNAGKTLNLKDYDPSKHSTNTFVTFKTGSELIVDGHVNATIDATKNLSKSIAFQGSDGTMTIRGTVLIDGFKQGGIANFKAVEIYGSDASLTMTNNGYGSNTAAIKVSQGKVIAHDNEVGFTAKLETSNSATVEVTNNSILGINLLDGSELKDATITALNNGKGETTDANRATDIAIQTKTGKVTIDGYANVNAGTIRAYYDKFSSEGPKFSEATVELNGTHARLTYSNLITEDNATNESLTFNPVLGAYKDNGTKTTTVVGDIYGELTIEEGETLIVSENAKISNALVELTGSATVINNSNAPVEVYDEEGHGFTVAANSTKNITIENDEGNTKPESKEFNVYLRIDGEDEAYTVREGATVKDLKDSLTMAGVKFNVLTDKDGKTLSDDTVLVKDMLIIVANKTITEAPKTLDAIAGYAVLALASLGLVGISAKKYLRKN